MNAAGTGLAPSCGNVTLHAPPRLDSQPVTGGLESRTDPDPRVRPVHRARRRRRRLDRRTPLARPRRRPGDGHRPRGLGRALRPRRRTSLPRRHRLADLLRLRRAQAADRRPVHLGGRPRHLGRDRARRARRLDRLPPPRHLLHRSGRHPRPRRGRRPGHRPLGQLLQPGAFRRPHHPAVGAGDRAGPPGHRPRRDHLPPDLPVRVAVGPGARRRADPGRPPLRPPPRPGVRAVRRGLHAGPLLDRGAAGRSRPRDPRPAAEPVDLDRHLPVRRRVPAAVPQPDGGGAGRRPRGGRRGRRPRPPAGPGRRARARRRGGRRPDHRPGRHSGDGRHRLRFRGLRFRGFRRRRGGLR